MISFLTDITVDGVALWVVLLICVGVFLGAFMDAIAGGGGIITVPTYLMGLSNLPIYNALGTNKLSSGIGTIFSTARFIHQGLVDWKLFAPAVILSLTGSVCGTWLQHHTPAVVLKYLLLVCCRWWRSSPCGPGSGRMKQRRWTLGCGGSSSGARPLSSADMTGITAPAPAPS